MARLDGVDISGWDAGIDTRALSADFVIVKTTEGVQGTRYNPGYRAMADGVLESGKLLGFYHYANGGDPIAEADCFADSIMDYKGCAIACLDWEGQGNPLFFTGNDVAWCKRFLDRLRERFGGKLLLYTSKGVCNAYDWDVVARDYGMWGAEYAYDEYTYQGYPDEPWQSDRPWGAWGHGELIHQFGYVNPQPNNGGIPSLDGNVFHGTREDWAKLCGEETTVRPVSRVEHVDVAERAACIHFDMVSDERNGYSQAPVRWGGDHPDGMKRVELPGGAVEYALGSYDCSSSDILAWRLALKGTKYEGALDGATYTGDMREVFLASGLFYADRTPARRGDVYLNDGTHTAMCQDGGLGDGPFGYDCLSHFRGNEWGGITGGEVGDQTGGESCVAPFYEAWATTLHYNHKADYDITHDEPAPAHKPMPEQHPGDKKNSVGIHYRAHCQRAGWLPAVRDGQTAGTEGYSARMEAIKISPPEGVTLDVVAHLQGIGDVWYQGLRAGERSGTESSDIDPIIGTVGESRRIEGIEIDVVDWPRELAGMWLYYQLHLQGIGWTDHVRAGEYCGTRGQSRRAEAIRMWIA